MKLFTADSASRRRRRTKRGFALIVISTLVVGSSSTTAFAATKKPAPKPTPSVAGFCAASKAWKAYEVDWFANGAVNDAWVRDTEAIMKKLVATAPKAIRRPMLSLAVEILYQRGDAVKFGKNPGDEETLNDLIVGAGIDAAQIPSSFPGARDAVGAYALKNCKVDVLQPFRDFAAANS